MDMEPADMRAYSISNCVLGDQYKRYFLLQLMGKKKKFKQNYKETLPLAQGDRNKEVEGCRGKELHWPLTEMSIVFFSNNEHLDKR